MKITALQISHKIYSIMLATQIINYPIHTFSIDGINDFGMFMPTVASTNSTLVMDSSGSTFQHEETKMIIVSDA